MTFKPVVSSLLLILLLVEMLLSAVATESSKQPAELTPEGITFFESKIRPALVEHCYECHSTDAKKIKGGLLLDSREGWMKGGEMGPVIVPGDPDGSLLIKAIRYSDEDLQMPPKKRLPAQQVRSFEAWVKMGAPDPRENARSVVKVNGIDFSEARKFWSFQPPNDYTPPQVRDKSWPKNLIDNFILAKLEEQGLSPVPPADRRVLIRRVTYNLTGLPPLPAEIDAFLADESPEAYNKLIDRLLNSPHYGEKWGRNWLDSVRYADTTSSEGSFIMRFAYRYRDYVVRAFNDDKPYDQFIVEQLAGDLVPATRDLDIAAQRMIATGFLLLGEKMLVAGDKEQLRWDMIEEQIDTVSRSMLGLTVSCARCHDHKFDPIPTRDYYALAGIFRSTRCLQDDKPGSNISAWTEMPLLQIPGEQRIFIMAPQEATPANVRIHIRGGYANLGAEVPRGFPTILNPEPQATISTSQSGRLELARWIASPKNPLAARVMANRIWQGHFGVGLVATCDNFGSLGARPSHPELLDWLASRFVESGWSVKSMHRLILLSNTYQMQAASDQNSPQMDPENRLLRHMNRRRLTAEEVRDSILAFSGELDRTVGGSIFDWENKAGYTDPERGLFSATDMKPGTNYQYLQSLRRSIYLPIIRNRLPAVFDLFDFADPNTSNSQRSETTTAPQSLFLMNSKFVRERTLHFARQLMFGLSDNPLFKTLLRLGVTTVNDEDRIRLAYVQVLGRPPRAEELAEAITFLDEYTRRRKASGFAEEEARLAAWQSYCQSLFLLNEFLYLS